MVVRLVVLLACVQGCAYEGEPVASVADGSVGDPFDGYELGGFAGDGPAPMLDALPATSSGSPSRQDAWVQAWQGLADAPEAPSGDGEEAEQWAGTQAKAPMVFRELPHAWSSVFPGSWFEARNESHFGAGRVRVPVRARRRPLLEDLEADDVLILDVRSTGCFHHDEYAVVIEGGRPMRAEVTSIQGERRPASFHYDTTEHTVAFTLSEDDVEAVNDALEYYRGRPETGCTTYELFHVDWRLDGRTPLVEYLDDGSCGSWDGSPGLVRLLREHLEGRPPRSLRPKRGWNAVFSDLVEIVAFDL